MVDVTETQRGFRRYGEDVTCSYGSKISVYESSSAKGPHVWLRVEESPHLGKSSAQGEGFAHLNPEQARAVIERLQFWLDEIPKRWGTDDAD